MNVFEAVSRESPVKITILLRLEELYIVLRLKAFSMLILKNFQYAKG